MYAILVAISVLAFLGLSTADVFVEERNPEELEQMGVELHHM